MAQRNDIISISYHQEDSTAYSEGDLDVGISSTLDDFLRLYAKEYGGIDEAKSEVFYCIVEAMSRFTEFNGTPKLRKLFEKVRELLKKEDNRQLTQSSTAKMIS